MGIPITLPDISEEQALAYILTSLRQQVDASSDRATKRNFDLTKVIEARLLQEQHRYNTLQPGGGTRMFYFDLLKNSAPFYCAAANLCDRGVLAPQPVSIPANATGSVLVGVRFYITEYGLAWLKDTKEEACLPTEYGRFSQLLQGHAARFGEGYASRSGEALGCYASHNYLACCAMCGAAAESILLALAIAKNGLESVVLGEYKSASGRAKTTNNLIGQQDARTKDRFATFTELLNYWRDESAHGTRSGIDEEEAFMALLLLLRFAQFAQNNWTLLTT